MKLVVNAGGLPNALHPYFHVVFDEDAAPFALSMAGVGHAMLGMAVVLGAPQAAETILPHFVLMPTDCGLRLEQRVLPNARNQVRSRLGSS